MPQSRLEYLFNRHIAHQCSPQDEKELMELLDQPGNEAEVQLLIDKLFQDKGSEAQMSGQVAASIFKRILKKEKAVVVPLKGKRPVFKPWARIAAAAVLLIAATSYWVLLHESKTAIKSETASIKKTFHPLPGGNHARLTMTDGSTIVLDSVQNGIIQHGDERINKHNGLVIFNASGSSDTNPSIADNMLSTPRGGKYRIVLSDGTKVWLNASSSIQFPTTFTGGQREVKLTGEAYFEVAKNEKRPFSVKVGEMEIKVLGTHFNINAYDDEEAIKTSLFEGSVKVINGDKSELLKPGQQGVLKRQDDKLTVAEGNMSQALAWKNGLFQFEGADVVTIMHEISRWYDVEIEYTGEAPKRQFEGKISRDAELSDVLKILQLSNLKFTMEGNKIIIQ